ncbi:hypothetical protein ACG2LH_16040 [Zhouia sp. PK063]|uniref:hypothetical protein n=1 Tax=Zhouia sp. PK063 TaxID=3373602 RepID=UPI00378D3E3C
MYGRLLIKAFKKIKEQFGNISDTRKGEELCAIIEQQTTENGRFDTLGGRRLRDLRDQATLGQEISLRSGIADALSQYLGYANFIDFQSQMREENSSLLEKWKRTYNKHRAKVIGTLALILIAVLVLGYGISKQRWMIWDKDHYIEVDFTKERYKKGVLKMYNEYTLAHFKQIYPDCNTEIFSGDGKPLVWYGKNPDKVYEFFNMDGEHPLTGKDLRPVTGYIFEKYICPKDSLNKSNQ